MTNDYNCIIILSENEGNEMTNLEMREAKTLLHVIIIDTILEYNPNDKEFAQLLEYVINLTKNDKIY